MTYYSIRGGGWFSNAFHCRMADRDNLTHDFCYYNVGFRLTKKLKL